MENRLRPVGKQALLSLEKVVEERKPHTASAAAQNNWDHCAGGTGGAELEPASSWGWQEPGAGTGRGCDVVSQSCLGRVGVPLGSMRTHPCLRQPLLPSQDSSYGSWLSPHWVSGGSFGETSKISCSSEFGKNPPNQDLPVFSIKFDLNELLSTGGE